MALIPCSECQREISNKATICPHCGIAVSDGVLTTQQTSKRFKAMQFAGAAAAFSGIAMLFALFKDTSPSPETAIFASGLALSGGLLYMAGRLLAWWHHG